MTASHQLSRSRQGLRTDRHRRTEVPAGQDPCPAGPGRRRCGGSATPIRGGGAGWTISIGTAARSHARRPLPRATAARRTSTASCTPSAAPASSSIDPSCSGSRTARQRRWARSPTNGAGARVTRGDGRREHVADADRRRLPRPRVRRRRVIGGIAPETVNNLKRQLSGSGPLPNLSHNPS